MSMGESLSAFKYTLKSGIWDVYGISMGESLSEHLKIVKVCIYAVWWRKNRWTRRHGRIDLSLE